MVQRSRRSIIRTRSTVRTVFVPTLNVTLNASSGHLLLDFTAVSWFQVTCPGFISAADGCRHRVIWWILINSQSAINQYTRSSFSPETITVQRIQPDQPSWYFQIGIWTTDMAVTKNTTTPRSPPPWPHLIDSHHVAHSWRWTDSPAANSLKKPSAGRPTGHSDALSGYSWLSADHCTVCSTRPPSAPLPHLKTLQNTTN